MKKDNEKNKNKKGDFLYGILVFICVLLLLFIIIYMNTVAKKKEEETTISYTDLIKQISIKTRRVIIFRW